MLTQLATQMDIATQTVRYTSDSSTLLIGLIALLGVSASMIIIITLRARCAPISRGALAVCRLHRVQTRTA